MFGYYWKLSRVARMVLVMSMILEHSLTSGEINCEQPANFTMEMAERNAKKNQGDLSCMSSLGFAGRQRERAVRTDPCVPRRRLRPWFEDHRRKRFCAWPVSLLGVAQVSGDPTLLRRCPDQLQLDPDCCSLRLWVNLNSTTKLFLKLTSLD
jgi:hypothetical protein